MNRIYFIFIESKTLKGEAALASLLLYHQKYGPLHIVVFFSML